jgi:MHS family shikimate/dehydroshikimate transporter-like MFS transporter
MFSVVFLAGFIYPFFLLLRTEQPALVVIAFVVATSLGVAPMIAVQPVLCRAVRGRGPLQRVRRLA